MHAHSVFIQLHVHRVYLRYNAPAHPWCQDSVHPDRMRSDALLLVEQRYSGIYKYTERVHKSQKHIDNVI